MKRLTRHYVRAPLTNHRNFEFYENSGHYKKKAALASTVQSPQDTEDDEIIESVSYQFDVDMMTFSSNPYCAQEQRGNGSSRPEPDFESQQQLQSPLSNDSVTDVIFLVDGSDSFNKINTGKNFLAPHNLLCDDIAGSNPTVGILFFRNLGNFKMAKKG